MNGSSDKNIEYFKIGENDKFYLRSDRFSFCNGIHYLPDEEQIKSEDIVDLLNKLYNSSEMWRVMIDEFIDQLKKRGEDD